MCEEIDLGNASVVHNGRRAQVAGSHSNFRPALGTLPMVLRHLFSMLATEFTYLRDLCLAAIVKNNPPIG